MTLLLDQGPLRRLRIIHAVVGGGLLCVLLVAPRLWLGDPLFAPVPVPGLPVWPASGLQLCYWLLLALLILGFLPLQRRLVITLTCGVLICRCVWDQMTWQPFLLQYICMLACLSSIDWRPGRSDSSKINAALNAQRLIMVSIYLWSGLHKLHYTFLVYGGTSFTHELVGDMPLAVRMAVGAVLGGGEALAAAMLLSRRFRHAGVIGLWIMHAVILVGVGPIGQDTNVVVWPWNIAMILLLPALFWGAPEPGPRDILKGRRSLMHAAIVVLFVFCPLLSYLGMWPTYLSFRLYAQRYATAFIRVKGSAVAGLSPSIRNWYRHQPTGDYAGHVVLDAWVEGELRVFPPPQDAVFKEIARRYFETLDDPSTMLLVISEVPHWRTGMRRFRSYSLSDLESTEPGSDSPK